MIVPLISGISVSVYWMLFSCILLVRLFLAKTTSYAREARHTIPKIWKQHSMNSHGYPWYQYIAFIVPQSMFTLPRLSKTLQYLHDWCACGPFWPFPAAPPWKGGRRHQGVSPFYKHIRLRMWPGRITCTFLRCTDIRNILCSRIYVYLAF